MKEKQVAKQTIAKEMKSQEIQTIWITDEQYVNNKRHNLNQGVNSKESYLK